MIHARKQATLSTIFIAHLLLPYHSANAQSLRGAGDAGDLFIKNCSSCHGKEMQGGLASSLLDDEWETDGSDSALAAVIRDGLTSAGMPAWKKSLSDDQIRSLVILIREQRSKVAQKTTQQAQPNDRNGDQATIKTKLHSFNTSVAGTGTDTLWGLDFLPDGSMLATQKSGVLWRFHNGKRTEIKGTPEVWHKRQGGLLDVLVHPGKLNQQANELPWVYLSFSEASEDKRFGATKIVRGKIKNDRWIDQETLFQVEDKNKKSYGLHFGSRIVYQDGYIYFSTGEENRPPTAQDLSLLNGKIHRLHDDGRIPKDNPFVKDKNALASVWSYGHRNPQGLDIDPVSGKLFESEHGPRGGDEINIIKKGENYGWPKVTFGMHYDGRPISALTTAPGMVDPIHYWVPSIATCGIKFYNGDKFPSWKNHLFVAGLRSQSLHRLKIEDDKVVEEEVVLQGFGRVRDMAVGPDGLIYVAVNEKNKHRIIKLQPNDAK